MNHDPMCSFQVPTSYCKECDLIARVREDTWKSADAVVNAMREETLRDAVEAVKALLVLPCPADERPWTTDEGLLAAVAAIEALGGEQ